MIMWSLIRQTRSPAPLSYADNAPANNWPARSNINYCPGQQVMVSTTTFYNSELDDLVYECLHPDPTERPTLRQLKLRIHKHMDDLQQRMVYWPQQVAVVNGVNRQQVTGLPNPWPLGGPA